MDERFLGAVKDGATAIADEIRDLEVDRRALVITADAKISPVACDNPTDSSAKADLARCAVIDVRPIKTGQDGVTRSDHGEVRCTGSDICLMEECGIRAMSNESPKFGTLGARPRVECDTT